MKIACDRSEGSCVQCVTFTCACVCFMTVFDSDSFDSDGNIYAGLSVGFERKFCSFAYLTSDDWLDKGY